MFSRRTYAPTMRSLCLAALLALFLARLASAQDCGPWYVLGRFQAKFDAGSTAAPLAPEKLLKQLTAGGPSPDFTATFDAGNRETAVWTKLGGAWAGPALDGGRLDLNAVCPPPERRKGELGNAVCYLYRRIDAPSDMELAVTMGSDDGLRLWLNGELLVDRHVARGLVLQDDFAVLALQQGVNHLLVKVSNSGGAFAYQIQPWSKISQQAINDAIDRGVEFLIQRQWIDGSWGVWENWGGGHAAFTAYTLLKCGVRRDHPAVRMALKFAEERPVDTTYGLSCLILALEATGDAARRERLAAAVDELVAIQASSGLFDYPVYPGGSRPEVDMSNTLYAALALRAAHKTSIDVPDAVWSKLASGSLKCLERARRSSDAAGNERQVAGFSYRVGGKASGSITSAGLSVIAIADEIAGERMAPALRAKIASAKEVGMAWLEQNMIWSVNPGQGAGHLYFWIYGLERVGALYNVERIGSVDWYWDGASVLLKGQADNGSWNQGYQHHEYLDTLLALLFLQKATSRSSGESSKVGVFETKDAQADVSLRATGDTPLTLWVSGLADSIVDELGASDRSLDVVRVDYLARYETDTGEPQSIGSMAGTSAKRAEFQRFAIRNVFDRRGKWLVKARVAIRAPASVDATTDEPAVREFESPELEVKIDGVIDPARLEYAGDLARNVLFGARAKFTASSQLSDQEAPGQVADGSFRTRWRSSKDDEAPWLKIAPERSIKCDRLLLSQALPRLVDAAGARIAEVEVTVNQKEHFTVALSDDVLEKTTLDFGETLQIREMEIRVMRSTARTLGTDGVGFAEVEWLKTR